MCNCTDQKGITQDQFSNSMAYLGSVVSSVHLVVGASREVVVSPVGWGFQIFKVVVNDTSLIKTVMSGLPTDRVDLIVDMKLPKTT